MVDIHYTEQSFKSAQARLIKSNISKKNKKLITDFISDASLGQHNPEKAVTKQVSKGKLAPYICFLIRLSAYMNKDWTQVTKEDLNRLIRDLQEDKLKNKNNGKPLTECTKLHLRRLLKMFLRWVCNNQNVTIPYKIIPCSDIKRTLPEYMTKEQTENLMRASPNQLYKTLILTLFDGGFRIGEALNIRLRDIRYIDSSSKNKLMFIDVRYSKTEARNPEMYLAQELIEQWLKVHPEKDNPDAYLFPVNYDACRIYFKKLAKKVLPSTRIYPHLFRHSSATYYASRMNRQQLCIRYGWAFSSKMPDIYIRRVGVDNAAVIQAFETENINDLKKQNQSLNEQMKILNAQISDKKIREICMNILIKKGVLKT